eukprot:13029808-Heterocapsa_arctica.AAC.1
MACQGRAFSSAGPQASMPTAFPVPIPLKMYNNSWGLSGSILGSLATHSYEIMTSREWEPVQSSDHLS